MAYMDVSGGRIAYTVTGPHETLRAPAPVLVFVHGLMLPSQSWDQQVAEFSRDHRVVTFDLRGQGRSEHSRQGLDLDSLALDTADLICQVTAQSGGGPVHLVGFSMGSFIALRVAARRPDLLRSLTLIGPSADAEEPENLPRYRLLIALVRWFGPGLFTEPMLKILFGRTFMEQSASQPTVAYWRRFLKSLPRSLARAAYASMTRKAIHAEISLITLPTLVVSGEEDRPVSPAKARAVSAAIAGSRFVAVAHTGHAVMIEKPKLFNDLLRAFLAQS